MATEPALVFHIDYMVGRGYSMGNSSSTKIRICRHESYACGYYVYLSYNLNNKYNLFNSFAEFSNVFDTDMCIPTRRRWGWLVKKRLVVFSND